MAFKGFVADVAHPNVGVYPDLAAYVAPALAERIILREFYHSLRIGFKQAPRLANSYAVAGVFKVRLVSLSLEQGRTVDFQKPARNACHFNQTRVRVCPQFFRVSP